MNTYFLRASGVCPNNGDTDAYAIIIESASPVQVERINAVTKVLLAVPVYQEDFTRHLAETLNAKVTVTGWHQGVFVTSRFG